MNAATEARGHSTREQRTRAGRITEGVALAAGFAAGFAPASLTGHGPIDAVERAVVVAIVTYVGAHGRRWAWLVAGTLVAAASRELSQVIALVGLAILVAGQWPKRRSRPVGAIGVGLTMNAIMWLPPSSVPWGFGAAVVAVLVLVTSGRRYLRSTRRRALDITLWVGIALAVLGSAATVAAMGLAYGGVTDGSEAARRALDAARDGDADATASSLVDARTSFDDALGTITGPLSYPGRLVPVVGQQLSAVTTTVEQGADVSETANDLATSANYDDLQYDGQLDLAQVDALVGPTARADEALLMASSELDDVLDGFLVSPLRGRITELSDEIDGARRDTDLATDLLQVTPGLFGAEGDRRYLIIFITPAELRGAGGFIGSWAELTASDGEVDLSRSGRIAELIQAAPPDTRTISGPADYLARYGRFRPQNFLQDVTFSPHFPSSAQVIAELYPQSGGAPVDGVISVDPTGLAALLELTGPVDVPGLDAPLSAQNAVEVLTKSQYIDFPDDAVRGDILTGATKVTFERLIQGSLPSPRRLADTLSPVTRSGHLRMWSPADDEQAMFERLGADGSLAVPTGGDGLSVVQQNTGNNKLDAYLQRTITYTPTIDVATGDLTATVRVELENQVPRLDLPDAVVGNSRAAPLGTNVTWLTLFTPHVVTGATLDGSPISLGPSVERGLNGWDTPLLQVPPGGSIVLEAELAGGVDLRDGYSFTLLPQPVANPDVFTVDLLLRNGLDRASDDAAVSLVRSEPVTAPWSTRRLVTR